VFPEVAPTVTPELIFTITVLDTEGLPAEVNTL
jgi:hypothetical protein